MLTSANFAFLAAHDNSRRGAAPRVIPGAGQIRVLCTAEQGTNLPFDQSAIPCHFWKSGEPDEDRKEGLREFWSQYIDRAPLVPLR